MQKIRLYNEYFATTQLGNTISDQVAFFVQSLLTQMPDIDLNDLENLINQTVGAEMAIARLRHATKLRKENERGKI